MSRYFKIMFFICIVVIEYLATTTREIEVVTGTWDKSNHFFAFFTLYILLSLSYKHMSVWMKSFYLMLFALQIEIVQYFIEGRYFSLLDIFADAIGMLIGIGVYKLLRGKYPLNLV